MATLTEQLATLLASRGVGTYTPGGVGGDIYLVTLPDEPDEAMAVALYPGGAPDPKLPYASPNVQVRVRGVAADTTSGETRAQAVHDVLNGLGPVDLGDGVTLLLATCVQSSPVYLGRDAAGRHEWAVNVNLELRRPTGLRP